MIRATLTSATPHSGKVTLGIKSARVRLGVVSMLLHLSIMVVPHFLAISALPLSLQPQSIKICLNINSVISSTPATTIEKTGAWVTEGEDYWSIGSVDTWGFAG